MLFSEFFKIIVNKVTFLGFRGDDRSNRPPLPWIRPCQEEQFGVTPPQTSVASCWMAPLRYKCAFFTAYRCKNSDKNNL